MSAGELRRRKPFRFPSLLAPPRAGARRCADRRRSRRSCTRRRAGTGRRARLTSTGRSSSATARSSGTTSGTPGRTRSPRTASSTTCRRRSSGTCRSSSVAAVASTVLFSSIALREWGTRAVWPSRVFGVLAAAPMFTGLYAYSLGFTAMLATLKLLQLRRLWLAALFAALTVGFSPLAFAFLCLIVGSYAVSRAADRAPARLVRGRPGRSRPGSRWPRSSLFPAGTRRRTRSTGSTSSRCSVVTRARRPRRAEGPRRRRRSSAFFALWGLGSVVVLRRAVAARGQLDAAERLRLPGHAPHREPRRLPAAAPRRARARGARSPTTSCRTRCSSRRGSTTTRSRRASGGRRSASSARTTAAGLPRRGRADRGALGGVLDPEGRLPARARLVPAARRRRQPDALREPPRRRGLPALAALRRRPVRPPQHDGAARLGRRPAGSADRALARAPG